MFLIIYGFFVFIIGTLCLVYFHFRKKRDNAEDKNTYKSEIANNFLNVKNVINSQLFSKDDYVCSYLKVEPVNINLMEDKDMRLMSEALAAEFSGIIHDFKFIAVSKPEDNSELISQYSRERQNTTNAIRRSLFLEEITSSQGRVQDLKTPTREFYFMLWKEYETEKDFIKRVIDFRDRLMRCRVQAKVAEQKEIIKLIEQTTSPQYIIDEELNPEFNFTFIAEKMNGDGYNDEIS